jgi:hypothetical protein
MDTTKRYDPTPLAVLLLGFGLLVFIAMVSGCAATATPGHQHTHVKTPAHFKVSKRCRTIGKDYNEKVAVLVQKNCVRNGVTTVALVIFDTKNKGKAAALSAVMMVKRILGFDPVLRTLVVGKDKGTPFILSVVTDINSTAVAAKE